ncbi:GntP family permease [Ureibacillus acetophenoni]|uniref:H+/gluconate symporter-like permease n=1 Tax=Ureibacillus acetophenoni TaxID=614649 RepID=A0A285UHV3_9BACL|nr:GntP family permease [Ureibacillus acetophenoni]SOC41439.1 H+/gluconate symporter-like permease [Ureibacillus acetophenoni]
MVALSGLGILLGFIFLMIGSWKKINLLIVTLITSAIIAVFSGLDIAETWTGPYMSGFTSFASQYLLLFVIGAMFGKIMEDSGAGWRLANVVATKAGDKWSIPALVAITMILLYGGVSIFVIVFFILPIGKSLFQKLRIPWSYFPGIALIGTIPPVGMLPGSLQVLNIIPTTYFGTDLMAGAGVGIVATIVYLLGAALFVKILLKNADQHFDIKEFQSISANDIDEEALAKKAPNAILSVIPILTALLLINIFKMDIVMGLLVASIVGLLLFWKSLNNISTTVSKGVENGILPLIYVSVVVGVAKVVETVPFFEVMKTTLLELQINGMLKIMSTVSVVSAMTGSSSGSLTMITNLFGSEFLSWGYDPELIHRLMATTAIGFDSMPWNSVIVVMFTLSGVAYAKGYKHAFVTSVLLPIIAAFSILLVAPFFY